MSSYPVNFLVNFMTKEDLTPEEKRLKRNNLIVAIILGSIALTGILVPLLYYTGLKLPQ